MRSPLSCLVLAFAATGVELLAQTPSPRQPIGEDAVAQLRAIGSAATAKAAANDIAALRERFNGDAMLTLLRLGLGSDDERVVFGAVMLMPDQLAVPELRNAARILLPRLGDADCPVDPTTTTDLIGSVDMAATATAVRKLPVVQADWFLGALHRMVRLEHVPALCELALATKGVVRNGAFGNARMAAMYGDENVPLLIATWLQLRGVAPDPDSEGLPGVLTAALRTHLDAPPRRELAKDEPDDREPSLPEVPCMRWLLRCTGTAKDLPLLRRLVEEGSGELGNGALRVLGGMSDAESLEFLRTRPGDHDQRLPLMMARARRGDALALETLIAGNVEALPMGLFAASPARRRGFAAQLLALPLPDAFARLRDLQESVAGNPIWFAVPPYDDAWLADLEPLTAATEGLDVRLLRVLVAVVPGCATTRLADALLAYPAAELFAPGKADEDEHEYHEWRGDLGWSGVWPFLEVTRPEAFRQRLREGLRAEDVACRDRCAHLLVTLGDTENLEQLAATIERAEDPGSLWLQFGRTMTPQAIAILRARIQAPTEADDQVALLRALAVAHGMPHAFAADWGIYEPDLDDVRSALLAGDPATAFLRTAASEESLDHRWPLLAAWREPKVADFLRDRRRRAGLDADDLASYDLRWTLYEQGGSALRESWQLVRDGRYAVHYGMPRDVRCLARDLATLPWWIGELDGNCCRAGVAEEVMQEFFNREAMAFDNSKMAEPAFARLQRRLVPHLRRLRWSRLAEAFVVTGA
ncbi:MAG: hypothetical protein MUC36_22710 [Planctomycetes bacterium]|jgi:hypothetical protein|nr:hypothetical protein [Planctomycetota bacterium]